MNFRSVRNYFIERENISSGREWNRGYLLRTDNIFHADGHSRFVNDWTWASQMPGLAIITGAVHTAIAAVVATLSAAGFVLSCTVVPLVLWLGKLVGLNKGDVWQQTRKCLLVSGSFFVGGVIGVLGFAFVQTIGLGFGGKAIARAILKQKLRKKAAKENIFSSCMVSIGSFMDVFDKEKNVKWSDFRQMVLIRLKAPVVKRVQEETKIN